MVAPEPILEIIPGIASFFFQAQIFDFFQKRVKFIGNNTDKLFSKIYRRIGLGILIRVQNKVEKKGHYQLLTR